MSKAQWPSATPRIAPSELLATLPSGGGRRTVPATVAEALSRPTALASCSIAWCVGPRQGRRTGCRSPPHRVALLAQRWRSLTNHRSRGLFLQRVYSECLVPIMVCRHGCTSPQHLAHVHLGSRLRVRSFPVCVYAQVHLRDAPNGPLV